MATRYVDPNSSAGGNGTTNALTGTNRAYASLSEWESARQGTLTEVEEVICSTNGGAAHTGTVTINGWTTSSSNYIDLKVAAGHRHAGVWDNTKFRMTPTTFCIRVIAEHVRITGFQFYVAFTSGVTPTNQICIDIGNNFSAGQVQLQECIIRSNSTSSGHTGIALRTNSTLPSVIRNCVVYDWPTGISNPTGPLIYVYNTTVHGCATGVSGSNSEIVAKNVLVQDCTTACWSGTFHANCTNNASDDNTAPGANAVNGEVTFVNEAGDDFHLDSADTIARGNGSDLSADATFPFAGDIDGETRSAPWDIGADAVPAAATAALTGVSATGAAGAVVGASTLTLVGADGSSAAGAVVGVPLLALVGADAASAMTAPASAHGLAMTGAEATTAVTTPGLAVERTMAGVDTVSATASLAAMPTAALAGVAVAAVANAFSPPSTSTIGSQTGRTFLGFVDTRISQVAATTNFEGQSTYEINRWATNDRTNALIRVTGLSNIPADAIILNASINLYLDTGGGGAGTTTIKARRVLRNWVANQVTWNAYATGQSWQTGGGRGVDDIAAVDSASLDVNETPGYKSWSDAQLIADVQGFVDGSVANHGWLLYRDDALADEQWRTFRATENSTAATRPYLEVTWALPGGVDNSLTVALTGAAGAGAVGALSTETDATQSLSGVAGAGQTGAMLGVDAVTLTGVSQTTHLSVISTTSEKTLSGVTATGEHGVAGAAGDSTAALVGVGGTASPGALAIGPRVAMVDGVPAIAALGSVTLDAAHAVTGAEASAQTSSPLATPTVPILGEGATGGIGALATAQASLTGVSAHGAHGALTHARDLALTGVHATPTVGTLSNNQIPDFVDTVFVISRELHTQLAVSSTLDTEFSV